MEKIRIHTMLNRVKTYSVKVWSISNGTLCIDGKNESSGVEGTFYYPLNNIEHFNVIDEGKENGNLYSV